MNILHVVNIYFVLPYFIGDQFLYFNEKGNKQHVICSPSEHLEAYSRKMGFSYKEVEITREISPGKDLAAFCKISRYILKHKIDIVVGHTPKGALLAMMASSWMRVPRRIYFRHGLVYETMKGLKRGFMMNLDRLTAKLATRVVCVSPSLYTRSIEDKLNPAWKQIVLGKGTCGGIDAINKFNPENIDSEKMIVLKKQLNIDTDTFVIGYCGRIVRDKGIIELVDAFAGIQKTINRKVKLLLIGDFEKRDALPSITVEGIRANKDIIQTGFIFNDIEYYYSLMDLYILPSYREGFGMSVIEASAMEKPVLTTRITGCIDSIIEGKTGFFVQNTKLGIIQGITGIIQHPAAKELGLNGRKFVLEHFDYQKVWPILEKEIYFQK